MVICGDGGQLVQWEQLQEDSKVARDDFARRCVLKVLMAGDGGSKAENMG